MPSSGVHRRAQSDLVDAQPRGVDGREPPVQGRTDLKLVLKVVRCVPPGVHRLLSSHVPDAEGLVGVDVDEPARRTAHVL